MQFAVDLAVDLDQAFGGDGPHDLETFGNNGSAVFRPEHPYLLED